MKAHCAAAAAAPEFKSPDAFGVRYGVGSAGGTSCPTGMVEMPFASDTCERAAAVAGRPYSGNVNFYGLIPRGCVWYSAGGSFYFNTADGGGDHASFQPVCAGAPDSKPQRYPSSTNGWACWCACVYVGVFVRARVCACARACNVSRECKKHVFCFRWIDSCGVCV